MSEFIDSPAVTIESAASTPKRGDLRSRWMRELQRLSQFKTQIYIYGNVKDTVLYPVDAENWKLGPLREALFEFFRSQGVYQIIGGYDLLDGMIFTDDALPIVAPVAAPVAPAPSAPTTSPPMDAAHPDLPATMAQRYEQLVDWSDRNNKSQAKGGRHPRALQPEEPLDLALHQIRNCLLNNKIPCAFVVEFSSQLLGSPSNLQLSERLSFLRLVKAAMQSERVGVAEKEGAGVREVQNILILVCDKLTDLPPWLYLNNPFTGNIEIEAPRSYERRHFFERFLARASKLSESNSLNDLVDLTDGMSVRDLYGIRKVSRGANAELGPKELVDLYKYGERESEWDSLAPERLIHAEEELSRRVMGQPGAVSAVADVLRRARLHLSGAQHSSRSKPRGILFFAGPTGVGKTELAKAMAELVFGSEEACQRFDMSEYGQAHSDQRLMGAPPGYVGFEEGGQLTNRVKANPFSVLLFDEIEKAHPSILDKFLQILEDGRMTDGRGDTVYFSESLIVFTSNVGIYQLDPATQRPQVGFDGQPLLNVDPSVDTEYAAVRSKVLAGVEGYFKHILGRPELLNRIGQNIVVFDFVREETLRQIVEKKVLPSIAAQIEERWKVIVSFGPAVVDGLMELGGGDVSNGGRGIGNVAEAAVLNPLARVLFGLFEEENGTLKPTHLIVDALVHIEDGTQVRHDIEWRLEERQESSPESV